MKLDIKIHKTEDIMNISGVYDRNLKVIENHYGVHLSIRGDEIYLDTDKIDVIASIDHIFRQLIDISSRGIKLTERDVIYLIKLEERDILDWAKSVYFDRRAIVTTHTGKPIYPVSINQKEYVKALEQNDLVFGIGPAGTGKTYLAVLYAIAMLKENKVKKIILTRPAVEAGESLGFLPGDLKEKIDPYLTPLYDALYEVLGVETVNSLIEKSVIEIAPLAYMRGRTLDNAFVILDEAQNTTKKQMKMFLTRLGFQSKMIVTGDITQIDLPKGVESGLREVVNMLKGIDSIAIIEFDKIDVVRHPLVQKILERYDENEN